MAITPPQGSSFKVLRQTQPTKRLIIALDGFERQGKTHFALSAPSPIGYMQMDPGSETVDKIKKLNPNKDILHSSYYTSVKPGMSREEIALQVASPIWKRSATDFELALPKLRTLVIDTASEWFILLKLARFGKLTQIMPEDYAPVYAEYKRLLRMAYNHNCNLILIHKLKAEYVQPEQVEGQKRKPGKRTGNWVREGFNGTGYEVQINARCFKEDGQFQLEIQDCRQNPDLDGEVLPQEMCDFTNLGMLVYPDSKESDWR